MSPIVGNGVGQMGPIIYTGQGDNWNLPIVEVSSFDGSLSIRMMWSSSYSRTVLTKEISHRTPFWFEEPPNAKLWKDRLNQLNHHVSKFGLNISFGS